MRLLLLSLIALLLGGCMTSSKKLGEISLGMNKAQVIEILGQPASVSVPDADVELLRYQLRGTGPVMARPGGQIATGYTVQLHNGKVIAYGRDDEFRAIRIKTE